MEPIVVVYCGVCTLPVEYCEYTTTYDKCKKWHQENGISLQGEESVTTALENTTLSDKPSDAAAPATTTTTSSSEKEEVKLLPGGKIKKKEVPSVLITSTQRNKRKFITTVTGLELFGIKLAEAAKMFARKFNCSASVVKNPSLVEEIDIQGDVKEELVDFIQEKWPQVEESSIYFIEKGGKKTPAR